MASSWSTSNYDDDDDFSSFGNRGNTGSRYSKDDANELKNLQERIGQVENESVESTYRALRSLNEAKETGIKTAEELHNQGEKLKSIDEKLDDVDQTLTATQKNINQIKSIFGGFKNRFMSSSKSSNSLKEEKIPKSNTKEKISDKKKNNSPPQKPAFEVITGSDREKELNKNLDEMSSGLNILSSLAKDMKLELDRQNPMIDRITDKSHKTHEKMESQDRQMKKIK